MHHFKDGFSYRRVHREQSRLFTNISFGVNGCCFCFAIYYLSDFVSVEMIKPRRVVQGRGMAAV